MTQNLLAVWPVGRTGTTRRTCLFFFTMSEISRTWASPYTHASPPWLTGSPNLGGEKIGPSKNGSFRNTQPLQSNQKPLTPLPTITPLAWISNWSKVLSKYLIHFPNAPNPPIMRSDIIFPLQPRFPLCYPLCNRVLSRRACSYMMSNLCGIILTLCERTQVVMVVS